MNYYDKYMKYKIKYINLVNSIGGSTKALDNDKLALDNDILALEGANLFYNMRLTLYHPTNEKIKSFQLEIMKNTIQDNLTKYIQTNQSYDQEIKNLEATNTELFNKINSGNQVYTAQYENNQNIIKYKKNEMNKNENKIKEYNQLMNYLNKINQIIFETISSKILELDSYKNNPTSYLFL